MSAQGWIQGPLAAAVVAGDAPPAASCSAYLCFLHQMRGLEAILGCGEQPILSIFHHLEESRELGPALLLAFALHVLVSALTAWSSKFPYSTADPSTRPASILKWSIEYDRE